MITIEIKGWDESIPTNVKAAVEKHAEGNGWQIVGSLSMTVSPGDIIIEVDNYDDLDWVLEVKVYLSALIYVLWYGELLSSA